MMIYVKTTFVALHAYENAPEPVDYLRYPHRHRFNVKLYLEVTHNDRELEFFMVQQELNNIIDSILKEQGMKSCEWMAGEIIARASSIYPNRFLSCEVDEDGENGAIVNLNDVQINFDARKVTDPRKGGER